jgi:hypothetical protein
MLQAARNSDMLLRWTTSCLLFMSGFLTTSLAANENFFIHTYDMPAMFTSEVTNMPVDLEKYPWMLWYNTDQVSLSSVSLHVSISIGIRKCPS